MTNVELKPFDKGGVLLKVGDMVDIQLSDSEISGKICKIDGDVVSLKVFGYNGAFYKYEQFYASQAEIRVPKIMGFQCGFCKETKRELYDEIGEYPNKKLMCKDCKAKKDKAEKSKTVDIDVAYTYKAKIDKKYLQFMISDGITTGLFGRYTDFIKSEIPVGFEDEIPENASEKIMKGWKYTIHDKEDETLKGVLSLESIIKADAISAGALLEIATFGTIVYG